MNGRIRCFKGGEVGTIIGRVGGNVVYRASRDGVTERTFPEGSDTSYSAIPTKFVFSEALESALSHLEGVWECTTIEIRIEKPKGA